MTADSLLFALRDADVMLPLLCSVAAGALIGAEREFQGKPAGVRTHTLVCFTSALMTLLGLRMEEWTAALPPGTQVVSDMARMPHAILTGVGFLGAGVIFRSGASVHGLTTAASLWLTAALGIVFGAGLVELAAIGTTAALMVLVVLRVVQHLAAPRPRVRVDLSVPSESEFDGDRLAATLAAHGLAAGPPTVREDRASGLRRYTLLASVHGEGVGFERLSRALERETAVQALSVTPLENAEAAAGD